MHEKFFKNLEMMDRDQLLTQYSELYDSKYGTKPHHINGTKKTAEEIRKDIRDLVLDESRVIGQIKELVREELKRYL